MPYVFVSTQTRLVRPQGDDHPLAFQLSPLEDARRLAARRAASYYVARQRDIQWLLETGPCSVGDEESDPELMKSLDAKLIHQLGNNFKEWRTDLSPRVVLNKLEAHGYKLQNVSGVGQTCIFICHRPLDNEACSTQLPNGQ